MSRFESKGLGIVALELRHIDVEQADAHYAEHVDRDFYPPLRDFVTSGPLVAAVLEGDEAIEVVRAINGATDGRKAAPGTIRGDLSLSNRENLVHGSDGEESAAARDRALVPRLSDRHVFRGQPGKPLPRARRVSSRELDVSLLVCCDGWGAMRHTSSPITAPARRNGWPTVSSAATWRWI